MHTDTVPALELRRTYDAPRERIYQAWTTPAILKEFFAPNDVKVEDVAMDLRVGGAYHIAIRNGDGELLVVRGVYRELQAPSRIVCTWAWDEDDAALAKETLLTLEFHARGERTELILTHEFLRDKEQRDNHQGGWSKILDCLPRVLR